MKKVLSLVLVLAVCLGLCGCGGKTTKSTKQNTEFLVTFPDGSTDRVSVEQIEKFPSKYFGASIDVTGHIDRISVDAHGVYEIKLENGITLWVSKAFVDASKIDIGDYVSASGKMVTSEYEIRVGEATENGITPLHHITFVK